MGAWIEISVDTKIELGVASLLSWERGLKFILSQFDIMASTVAPLVGAWIEMAQISSKNQQTMSLLSWERGLKFRTSEL